MKKIFAIILVTVLFSGCTKAQVFDTTTKDKNSSEQVTQEDKIPNVYQEKLAIEVNFPFNYREDIIREGENASFANIEEISIPAQDVKTLSLSNMTLNDSSILSQYTNLEYLKVQESIINDFSFLSKLENLKYLDINSCVSEHFDEIASLPNKERLITLELTSSRLNDVYSEETGYENKVSDISFLNGFYNIESLNLLGNDISNIDVLSKLEKLKDVDFVDGNWKIKSLKPLYEIKTLEHILMSSVYQVTEDDITHFGDPNGDSGINGILELD